MNKENAAYLQELATEFGESSNGIRVELNRLTEANLLTSKIQGRTILYQANQNHNLYSTIREALHKNVGIDQVIQNIIERCGIIEAAWVTGDYARGIDSGLIDIVIQGSVNYSILQSAIEKTSKLINRKIRFLVLDRNEIKQLSKGLDLDRALPIWGQDK
jgi:hypothetical protein